MKQVFVHGLGQMPAAWEATLSRLGDGEERVCPGLAELLRGREADYKNLYGGFSDFCGRLWRIRCPVLVLCGSRDRANRKASIELAGLLKNAGFQVVAGAGHEINTEAPEALAERLRAFYKGLG